MRKVKGKLSDHDGTGYKRAGKPQRNKKDFKEIFSSLRIISELGFSLIVPLVGGAFLGSYLDNLFGSSPRLTLSLIFIGLFIGVVSMFKAIKDY